MGRLEEGNAPIAPSGAILRFLPVNWQFALPATSRSPPFGG